MAYFSKNAMQLINGANGEKMSDWGGHRYSDSHDTSGEDKYMPMVDSADHGQPYHPRAYNGALSKLQGEVDKGIVRRASGGAVSKKCGGSMKHRADGGDIEDKRRGGAVSKKCGGSMKHRADGGDIEDKRRGGKV